MKNKNINFKIEKPDSIILGKKSRNVLISFKNVLHTHKTFGFKNKTIKSRQDDSQSHIFNKFRLFEESTINELLSKGKFNGLELMYPKDISAEFYNATKDFFTKDEKVAIGRATNDLRLFFRINEDSNVLEFLGAEYTKGDTYKH